MKKLIYPLLAALTFISIQSCRPDEVVGGLDRFQLSLNTDIFNYRIKVDVVDANGNSIPNTELSIDGNDADHVYNEFGLKDFFIGSSGSITLVINPYEEPQIGQSAEFSVILSATGYIPGAVNIVVENGDFEPSYRIELLPESGTTKYGDVESYTLGLTNGAIASTGIYNKSGNSNLHIVGKNFKVDTVYYDDKLNTIIIPQGMHFTYWETVITQGSRIVPVYAPVATDFIDSVEVNGQWTYFTSTNIQELIGYDTTTYDITNRVKRDYIGSSVKVRTYYFDQGVYNPTRVIRGNESIRTVETLSKEEVPMNRAVLEPASIKMLSYVFYEGAIEGKPITLQPVQTKSSFITYSIQIDPNFINPTTSLPIAAGDSLEGLPFYRIAPQKFKTVKMAVVQTPNGQLRVQSNNYNAGIVRWLRFEWLYDYTVSVPLITSVPDINNVVYYGSINLGGYSVNGFRLRGRSSQFQRRFFGKLVSIDPISVSAGVDFNAYYWNENVVSTFFPGASFSKQLVQESDFDQLPPITNYKVEVVCTKNDSIRVNPTVDATTEVGGYNQTIRMINGVWATRGVKLNDPIDISIQFREFQFDTLFTVTETENLIQYYAQTNDDVCAF